jgi:hypothetical protein
MGTHRVGALGRAPADVGANATDVVAAERLLDLREVGQRGGAAAGAMRGGPVDVAAVAVALAGRALGRAPLNARRAAARVELPGQRLLARAER